MPKLVCPDCQLELRPQLNGVRVIEFASSGPYKIWAADEWSCPGCGKKVIAGFSENAIEQYEPNFAEQLTQIKPELFRFDFENELQREFFKESLDPELAERVRAEMAKEQADGTA